MKIKKGDTVIVVRGKDKGKKGKIEKLFPKKRTVLIPQINMFKKHLKKRDEKQQGGIIDFPKPLSLANVVLICPHCKKKTRVGYNSSQKLRICKKCQKPI